MLILLTSCIATVFAPSSAAITWPDQWIPEFDENGIDSPWARTVESKLLWGYIDKTGKFLIPPCYEKAEVFSKGCAVVKKDGKLFYIDHSGNKIRHLPKATNTDDDDFRVTNFNKDIFDVSGRTLIALAARHIIVYPFSDGLAAFRMPMHLIEQFYPENLPKGFSRTNYSEGDDEFGRCGYINELGRIIIPPQFEHAYRFVSGLAKVEGWQQTGFIDKTGNYVGRHPCSDVLPFRDGLALCSMMNDDWFFMDKSGRVILDHLEEATQLSEGRAAIMKNHKWSLIDDQGKNVCDLDADDVGMFSQGLATITRTHRKGFIDRNGSITIPLNFDEVGDFSEGMAPVAVAPTRKEKLSLLANKHDWQCGYIDPSGKLVIAPKFRGARFFSEGLAPVRIGLKWGYIDKTGAIKIDPKFDDANSFSEGLAGVRLGYLWGFIDRTGKFVISPRFGVPDRQERSDKSVGRFSEGVAICRQADFRWQYCNRKGKVCSANWPGDFPSEENNFHEGLALVQVRPGCNWTGNAYVDKQDKVVSKQYYALSSHAFSEGLAMVEYTSIDEKQEPRAGFIDNACQFVIAPTYSKARSFKEGLAAVAQGDWNGHDFVGKWGYTDRSGHKVIDLIFDDADDFSEGLAAIKIGAKWGFIDKTGKTIVVPKYDQVGKFASSRALVKQDNRYGFIDHDGKQVIDTRYWLAGPFSEGLALVVFPAYENENVTTTHTLSVPIRDETDLKDFVRHASGE
ncbi:MAG TPA: WG repeat-containing protein [Planktothrix sp.]|jgi:hypothetical protein